MPRHSVILSLDLRKHVRALLSCSSHNVQDILDVASANISKEAILSTSLRAISNTDRKNGSATRCSDCGALVPKGHACWSSEQPRSLINKRITKSCRLPSSRDLAKASAPKQRNCSPRRAQRLSFKTLMQPKPRQWQKASTNLGEKLLPSRATC